jgi:hypothetical protein
MCRRYVVRNLGDITRKKRKNPAPERGVSPVVLLSDGLQIGGSGLAAARVGLHVERDLLAFVEVAHAGALDCRNVYEHIRAAAVLHDEAEAFLAVEELNFSKTQSVRLCPTQTIRMGLISGFLRVLGERVRWDQNIQVRLNLECRLYRVVGPVWQSPSGWAQIGAETRGGRRAAGYHRLKDAVCAGNCPIWRHRGRPDVIGACSATRRAGRRL